MANIIHSTAIIEDGVRLGTNCIIGPYAIIGAWPPGRWRSVPKTEDLRVIIGDDVLIGSFVMILAGVEGNPTRIGNNCHFGNFTYVGHDSQIGNHIVMAGHSKIASRVVLEDGVRLAPNSFVDIGCVLTQKTYLGAGAFLRKTKTIPGQVYVGRPAKILRPRDPVLNRLEYFLTHKLRRGLRKIYIGGKRGSYR